MSGSPATARASSLARLLDSAFRVPGTRFRFGLDPLLGLVPGLGDAVAGSLAFYLLIVAFRAGAPPVVILHMFLNMGVDLLLGAVPLLGDFLDAGYKANLRNLTLLERFLDRPEATKRRSLVLLLLLGAVLILLLGVTIWIAISVLFALLDAL